MPKPQKYHVSQNKTVAVHKKTGAIRKLIKGKTDEKSI